MAEHQDEPYIHLTLRRVIGAPVQRVYAAWTDPELLKQWLAPGNAVASRAVAVEFEPESADRTRLTLTHARFAQDKARDEHERSWAECLEKLRELCAA